MLAGVSLLTPVDAISAPTVVKMATLAPEGSSWYRVLQEMGEEWRKASDGAVTLRIYPGGIAGDEDAMIRKMRVGQIQAAAITGIGLAYLEPSFYALHIPMMYESDEEFDSVRDRYAPVLERMMEEKGFVVLNWADGGWVHFFTKKPVAVPNDLRPLKLFTWAGDNASVEAWKASGFNPVPLPSTEIATALQTGLVEALGSPPQVSVITQTFNYAKNMTALRWQLLLGATLINKSTWEKIPADLRPALLQATREAGTRLQAEIRGSEARDIEAMQKRGLNVVPVGPQQMVEWQKVTAQLYPKIRGPIVPEGAFDEAMRYRDEYRKANPPKR